MKRIIILFLLALSLRAATYYVASTGNDSNAGTQPSPFLTFAHAVSQMGCGDTLIVVGNGSYVVANNAVPNYIPNCTTPSIVQSSKWNLFAPAGYRTNPVNDGPNYGKLEITSSGDSAFIVQPESHGNGQVAVINGGYACYINNIASDVFHTICTLGGGSQGIPNLANGIQLEIELAQVDQGGFTMPTNVTFQQWYYVVNCTNCGAANETFQLSVTPGGSPVTGITCSGTCAYSGVNGNAVMVVTMPLQVRLSDSTFIDNNYNVGAEWVNGLPVTLFSTGWAFYGSLPSSLQLDTQYYVCNISGQRYNLCTDSAGMHTVTLTSVGTGPLGVSSNNLASYWTFRGIEVTIQAGIGGTANLMTFNAGGSALIGLSSHIKIDHCWIHQIAGDTTPSVRGIEENLRYFSLYDSVVAGFTNGEGQALAGQGAAGPSIISNTMLEASGEDSLYGGGGTASGIANADHTFVGDFFYNAPVQKITWNCPAGATSGPCTNYRVGWNGYTGTSYPPDGYCWYDTADPFLPGGESYYDGPAAQWNTCGSDHAWHATGTNPLAASGCTNGFSEPSQCGSPDWKDITEIKSGTNFKWIGNVMQYMWATGGQTGEAMNLSAEFNGYTPGTRDDHILVTNNAIFNVYEFATRVSFCGSGTTAYYACGAPSGEHEIVNNLVVIDPRACGIASGSALLVGCSYAGNNQPLQLGGNNISNLPGSSESVTNNTIWLPDVGLQTMGQPPSITNGGDNGMCTVFTLAYNITNEGNIWGGDYSGACVTAGNVFPVYFRTSTATNNVMKFGTSSGYSPAGTGNIFDKSLTAFPTANSTISYVNGTGQPDGDYRLDPSSSPFSAAHGCTSFCSPNGTDLGADIDMVNMMTSGARPGVPNWDVQAHLFYDVGSTSVVIRYTAQNSGACTATLYGAPARISANQVASVADSAATSIQNGIDRNLLITGLTAGTTYYPILAGTGCPNALVGTGNGVVSFTTRAAGSGTTNFPFQWSSATAMRYSVNQDMSSSTSLGAATTQPIPVSHGTPIYAQVGTAGPITILIKN